MANGAEPSAFGPEIEAGKQDTQRGEEAKITHNDSSGDAETSPACNGVEVHWGFSLSDLYRIALKFYKGTWLEYLPVPAPLGHIWSLSALIRPDPVELLVQVSFVTGKLRTLNNPVY